MGVFRVVGGKGPRRFLRRVVKGGRVVEGPLVGGAVRVTRGNSVRKVRRVTQGLYGRGNLGTSSMVGRVGDGFGGW